MWHLRNIFKSGVPHLAAVAAGKAFVSSVFCECTSSSDNDRAEKIYLWGARSALPCGNTSNIFDDPLRWKCITFGPTFGAAVDRYGAVYVWGRTHNGRYVQPLSVGTDWVVDCWCSETDVYMLTYDGSVRVIRDIMKAFNSQDGCDTHTATAQKRGESRKTPFTSDESKNTQCIELSTENKPKIGYINGLQGKRIVKMSVGNGHAAFIDSKGNLYCSGENYHGQCGKKPANLQNPTTFLIFSMKNEAPDLVELHQVEFKDKNTKIVDVVCGGRHTCCLDSNGNVYTFGDDSAVQLLLGDTRGRAILELDQYKSPMKTPEPIAKSYTKYTHKDKHLQFNPIPVNRVGKLSEYRDLLDGAKISLSAGEDFTIVTATNGKGGSHASSLIASGGNRYGQCATIDVRMHKPKVVKLPGELDFNGLSCGSNHCVAAMKDGTLVAWGSNQQQQIGLEKHGNITTPSMLKLTASRDASAHRSVAGKIKFIRCAFNNTAIITG